MSNAFGALVRQAREAADESLRAVAEALIISAQYLCDIEHGRRFLGPAYWPSLVEVLPALSLEALARAIVDDGPVKIDLRNAPPEVRAYAVETLVSAAMSGKG